MRSLSECARPIDLGRSDSAGTVPVSRAQGPFPLPYDPDTETDPDPGSLPNPVDPSSRQQSVEQRRLRQCQDGVVLHAEKRGGGAERVLGVHHDDTPLAQRGFFRNQRRQVDRLGECLARDLQVGLRVARVLEQMLGRPDRVQIPRALRRLPQGPTGHGHGRPRDASAVFFDGLDLEEPAPLPGGRRAGRIDGTGAHRAHHADQVGMLFRQPQQRPPVGRVVHVVGVRVGGVDLEPADFIEADGRPVHRLAAQRRHQSFAPRHGSLSSSSPVTAAHQMSPNKSYPCVKTVPSGGHGARWGCAPSPRPIPPFPRPRTRPAQSRARPTTRSVVQVARDLRAREDSLCRATCSSPLRGLAKPPLPSHHRGQAV